jgi:pimeloyl-ACP methyl ester carboxylesterase
VTGLHVVERGPVDAPVVVLVHGSMDRANGMRPVARRLEHDYHVVLYDRRGYARSREVGGPYDVAAQVSDLLEVLAGRPATVFGHSQGGNIALAAAQRHPDLVLAVGAYEPPLPWEPWWHGAAAGAGALARAETDSPGAAAEAFMRRMVGDERWERLPAATRDERRADGPALVGELADLQRGPPYDAAQIRVPVLIARGEHSRPHHVQAASVLAERFGSPARQNEAEMVVVPSVGHGIHLEDPAAMAELVRRLSARVTER